MPFTAGAARSYANYIQRRLDECPAECVSCPPTASRIHQRSAVEGERRQGQCTDLVYPRLFTHPDTKTVALEGNGTAEQQARAFGESAAQGRCERDRPGKRQKVSSRRDL